MFSQYLLLCLSLLLTNIFCASGTDGNHTPAESDVSLGKDCPTWYAPKTNDSEKCSCGFTNGGRLKCLPNERVSIFVGNCMTYTNNQMLAGSCPYAIHNPKKPNSFFATLPKNVSELNEFMCGWMNRTGVLCSQCKTGLNLAALSYQRKCVECSNIGRDVVLFSFLAFVPSTIFFFIVIICNINIASGPLNAILTAVQVSLVSINETPSYAIFKSNNPITYYPTIILLTIYGIWNLDFFRYVIPPICISPSLTSLQAMALEYVIAVYPLVLIVVTYVCVELYDNGNCLLVTLCMPFKRLFNIQKLKDLNIKHSLLTAFATFLLLAFSRLFFVSKYFMVYDTMWNISGSFQSQVLRMDASIPFLSKSHIPYVVLAIIMIVIFNLIPFLLLLFYPTKWFQLLLGCFPRVNWHPLRAFMDIFQGCYKNGTNGTRDFRYFAAFNLLFRVVMVSPIFNRYIMPLVRILLPLIFSYIHGAFRPYRRDVYNNWDSFMFLLYGIGQIFVLSGIYSNKISSVISCFIHSIIFSYFLLLVIMMTTRTVAPGCQATVLKKIEMYQKYCNICNLLIQRLRRTDVNDRDFNRGEIEDHHDGSSSVSVPNLQDNQPLLPRFYNNRPTYGINNV